jgi:hypothetical protein
MMTAAKLLPVTMRKGRMMNKVTRTVLIVAAAAVAGAAIPWTEVFLRTPSIARQIEDGLRMEVAKIKPTLPKKIDEATTVTDVAAAGVVMTYYYRIDSENYAVPPDFMELMRKRVAELICKLDSKTMRAGAVYRYSYSDTHAKSLGTFDVKAADCPA